MFIGSQQICLSRFYLKRLNVFEENAEDFNMCL